MLKFLSVFALSSLLLLLRPIPALAVTAPNFPVCTSPQGETKVSYNSGVHGIAGSSGTYTGSDTVYNLSQNSLQCFCPEDGRGVQTNWWKVNTLSFDEVNALKSQGWVYVPSGAVWGLEDAPYLAFNSNYTCRGAVQGTTTSGAGTLPPLTQSAVCIRCIWWPILLGEIGILLAVFLYRRKGMNWRRRTVAGAVVALTAYIIFLLLNRSCPDGIIDLRLFTLPCRLFWLLAGLAWLIIALVLRPRSTASRPKSHHTYK